ncbi:MAG: FAD-dependent oxidoreductase [Mangrovicoccus sp.]|nr:FAD-dependent oxidoreductase [Mangrovicoccus sp.]
MAELTCDLCIIGAGSGGLSIAAGASQMGADVILLEGHKMGGDCLNYGCVPSKALIAAAHHTHAMGAGAPFGIAPVVPQVDFAAAKDHVAQSIKTIEPVDSQERFEGFGVRVIREFGRFISPTQVQAGEDVITARRFVIATGSRPALPPIPGLDSVPVLTNETLFDLRDQPEHLVVLGAGPIGLEMAQAHRRLGSKVTVLEAERALGREDPELAEVVRERLRAEGVEILENTRAEAVSGAAGAICVKTSTGDEITGSHLLVALGRHVNTDDLGLDLADVAHTPKGVTVGADLRSTNKRIYAVGDAAGGAQFTHLAGYHAGVVIRSILFGLPSKARTDHIPRATYTAPEIAHVGLSEAEASAKYGAKLTVARFDYAENDRAIATGQTEGLIKVMVVGGKPVGASIVGAQAGELIGIWALALANGLKMSAIANTVLPYPTLGEVNKRAAGMYFSPKLFDNPTVKRVVGLVQRYLP